MFNVSNLNYNKLLIFKLDIQFEAFSEGFNMHFGNGESGTH